MTPILQTLRLRRETAAGLRFGMVAVLWGGAWFANAQDPPEITSAAEVRKLSAAEAERRLPVRLRGVVTFFDETLFSRFIQDATAGIYLNPSTNTPALLPGQLVEVTGVTSPGEYAPVIEPAQVRVLGEAALPAAQSTAFEPLASGQMDSQFVEVAGIVRSVQFDEATQHHILTLATGGGRLIVHAKNLPMSETGDLADATVRVRGVCSTAFNRQRQLFAIRLLVPRPEDLVVEKPPPAEPFAAPARSIASLLQFTPQGSYGHRVKLAGTVVLQRPGNLLYIQNGPHGLEVQSRAKMPLQLGDVVEVLGFTAQGQYTPVLEDAVYRKIGRTRAPPPERIDVDAALSGSYDCRLVRLTAKVLDRARQSREQFLVLESGNFIFHANLEPRDGEDAFARLANGSTIAVAGICVIEPGDWKAGESWRAKSFQLRLRSPADVVVLAAPSWWTLRRLLWMVGVLVVVVLAAFAWVGVLRRRVQKQTGIIRQQLQAEAALKERYLDLFENANDIVFTHDLAGRFTSVNRTAERLLQRDRKALLSVKFVDLVAEDERTAAAHWLEQVVHGAELPVAEWDFLNASGQRVKLEISSRLVEPNGKPAEVEGVARDITERRRLERELLDISSREQRRIGHDLHDGVCQQLASIAYRLDILGDQLQEKGAAEAAEAGRIGALINEATVQARSVARGLFPVRLEENGLVSALDELADGASRRFRLACVFECPNPPAAVDNEVALHLYYIAQEALLNAIKHAKAARVVMTLSPEGECFRLAVRDDGGGFRPAGANRAGMGIRIMHYRARVIGATLNVNSEPGQGTRVSCVFFPGGRETMREADHG